MADTFASAWFVQLLERNGKRSALIAENRAEIHHFPETFPKPFCLAKSTRLRRDRRWKDDNFSDRFDRNFESLGVFLSVCSMNCCRSAEPSCGKCAYFQRSCRLSIMHGSSHFPIVWPIEKSRIAWLIFTVQHRILVSHRHSMGFSGG